MYLDKPIPSNLLGMLRKIPEYANADAGCFAVSLPTELKNDTKNNTLIWVKGLASRGYYGATSLAYTRDDIGIAFQGLDFMVPQEYATNPLAGLMEYYGISLPAADFDVETISDTQLILRAKPESYYYVGQLTLSVSLMTPLSDPLKEDRSLLGEKRAELYLAPHTFLTLGTLSKVVDDSAESLQIVADALKMETLDPWKRTKTPNPYNLYGAKVVHNGPHEHTLRKEPLLLSVAISDEHCTNMTGTLNLFYSIPKQNT